MKNDVTNQKKPTARSRFFAPLLPGANLRDRALACCGAVVGIGLTGALCSFALGKSPQLPLLAVADHGHVHGLVTQTDLLAALAPSPALAT